jgi:hypothetical protein
VMMKNAKGRRGRGGGGRVMIRIGLWGGVGLADGSGEKCVLLGLIGLAFCRIAYTHGERRSFPPSCECSVQPLACEWISTERFYRKSSHRVCSTILS